MNSQLAVSACSLSYMRRRPTVDLDGTITLEAVIVVVGREDMCDVVQ